jgi:TetR/AcrR family transcriptional regulator, tetracycline repressor protein
MTAGGGQAGSGRPVGPALSASQVLDAGMQILETEGVDGLTIRGLAAKLGVAATSIYWHVGDKQALLDALAERVIAQLADVSVRGRKPEDRIISIAKSLRTTLLERAELVALVHRQGRTAALFQPARRVLLREVTAAGVSGPTAALAVQAVLSLVIGSVLLDRQLERQPAQRNTPEELWAPTDAEHAPELLAHLSRPVDEESSFDYTLTALVTAFTHA